MGSNIPSLTLVETPGTESWSTRIRKRARTLAKTIETGYMELAEIIYKVFDTPINGDPKNAGVYTSWGYKSYTEWAEEELGLHKRKAERLKNIWYHLEEVLGDQLDPRLRKRIVELGWGKVRELVRVLSPVNAEEWTEMAENLTHQELCIAIRKALEEQEKHDQAKQVGEDEDAEEEETKPPAPLPPDIARFRWKKFFLTPEQIATVDMALDRAKQLSNSDKPGHCLEMICTDFLATNTFGKSDDPLAALKILAKFERLLGKKVIVVDPESLKIEYGFKILEQVAGAKDDE